MTAAVTIAGLAFKLPSMTGPVPVKSIVAAGWWFGSWMVKATVMGTLTPLAVSR